MTKASTNFKTVLVDAATGRPHVPNGSMGFRYGESGAGKWNLDLEGVDPALSLVRGGQVRNRRGPAPAIRRRSGERRGRRVHRRGSRPPDWRQFRVTPCHHRLRPDDGSVRSRPEGLPGEWPTGYDDPAPCHRRGRRDHRSVPASMAIRIGREFASNAEESGGRSMIILGPGPTTGSTPTPSTVRSSP